MYQVGETVLYGMDGVCKILEIAAKDFGKGPTDYYILKPVYSNGSTIFVPTGSEELTAKMRRVLSAEEIYALIEAMPEEDTIWIDDENQRKQRYQEILHSDDREGMVQLIKTLYLKQQELQARGRKLQAADERAKEEAERILYEEFAHVLSIQRDQVLPFIMRQLEPEERDRQAGEG